MQDIQEDILVPSSHGRDRVRDRDGIVIHRSDLNSHRRGTQSPGLIAHRVGERFLTVVVRCWSVGKRLAVRCDRDRTAVGGCPYRLDRQHGAGARNDSVVGQNIERVIRGVFVEVEGIVHRGEVLRDGNGRRDKVHQCGIDGTIHLEDREAAASPFGRVRREESLPTRFCTHTDRSQNLRIPSRTDGEAGEGSELIDQSSCRGARSRPTIAKRVAVFDRLIANEFDSARIVLDIHIGRENTVPCWAACVSQVVDDDSKEKLLTEGKRRQHITLRIDR